MRKPLGILICSLLPLALLARPDSAAAEDAFIRPLRPGDPLIYGVREGIVLAVHPHALDARPKGGPRGLLRVGYIEEGRRYLINYIAVEPVVDGQRGLSELEHSADGRPGKRFGVSPAPDVDPRGRSAEQTYRMLDTRAGKALTFVVHVEPFANGARPLIEATLFAARPTEVRFRTLSASGGAVMSHCILTATMGNQSRCRTLWLRDGPVDSRDLYEGYGGHGFVEKGTVSGKRLHRTSEGALVAVITPSEFEPREVFPLPNRAWHHPGRWMAQFWRKAPGTHEASLHVRVNGRRVYWGGRVPIPGGVSYENFELRERFRPGTESWFGFTTMSPQKAFGFPYDVPPTRETRRRVIPRERKEIQAAKRHRRRLRGAFAPGLDAWSSGDGASPFRLFDQAGSKALTTFGKNREADTGRLYQCFVVPDDARVLRFYLHGGADPEELYVALWNDARLIRKMTGRDHNDPFEVQWDLIPQRGEVLTFEIVDRARGPWGFIGIHGIEIR